MKMSKLVFLPFFAFLMAGTMISCDNSASGADKSEQTGPEYTSAYVCPMHCDGSGSAEAGVCPECGMDYVANEDFKGESNSKTEKEGHSHDGHDHNHDGHEHGDHEGHQH